MISCGYTKHLLIYLWVYFSPWVKATEPVMANATAKVESLDTSANGSPLVLLLYLPLSTFLLWSLWGHLASPLRKYPGPFLASQSELA